MASGAALRARAISAFLSVIRYWSSGAMLGYCALASCARPCHAVLSRTTSARLPSVILLIMLRFIDLPLRYGRNSCILYRLIIHTGMYAGWQHNVNIRTRPIIDCSRKAGVLAVRLLRSMLQP